MQDSRRCFALVAPCRSSSVHGTDEETTSEKQGWGQRVARSQHCQLAWNVSLLLSVSFEPTNDSNSEGFFGFFPPSSAILSIGISFGSNKCSSDAPLPFCSHFPMCPCEAIAVSSAQFGREGTQAPNKVYDSKYSYTTVNEGSQILKLGEVQRHNLDVQSLPPPQQ